MVESVCNVEVSFPKNNGPKIPKEFEYPPCWAGWGRCNGATHMVCHFDF